MCSAIETQSLRHVRSILMEPVLRCAEPGQVLVAQVRHRNARVETDHHGLQGASWSWASGQLRLLAEALHFHLQPVDRLEQLHHPGLPPTLAWLFVPLVTSSVAPSRSCVLHGITWIGCMATLA